jgi:long-chain acyl-CoA synthetase
VADPPRERRLPDVYDEGGYRRHLRGKTPNQIKDNLQPVKVGLSADDMGALRTVSALLLEFPVCGCSRLPKRRAAGCRRNGEQEAEMNIAKLRELKVLQEPEQVSFVSGGREWTNHEFLSGARRLVTALRDLGIRRGDRVIVQMPNRVEVLLSFGAIWRLGAIVVPVNYLLADDEIAAIYEDSGARAVISVKEYLLKIQTARSKAPQLQTVILVDDDVPEGMYSFHALLKQAQETKEIVETDDDEVAALIYTAGTTGASKGVMLTHFNLCSNSKMSYESTRMPHGMTNITVLPLCHAYGIAVANSGLFYERTKSVILGSFDLETLFASIDRYDAKLVALVPTMYVFMLMYPNPNKHDIRRVRYWMCGSAPLSQTTWNQFYERFGGKIIEGWGLSESGASGSANPCDGRPIKVGSIGIPFKGLQMGIMDDRGNFLGPRQSGEIVIKGPSIMKGYWNKPEETAKTIVDGWLHTGDIGYVDEDGYYWITDRKKDLIIKGGENISPRTIEEVLYAHPKIVEAAVIAMKDDVYGENIKAFVALKPGLEATAQEVLEHCKSRLASFFVPKEVVFLPALPKNLVGKILKKELRKL